MADTHSPLSQSVTEPVRLRPREHRTVTGVVASVTSLVMSGFEQADSQGSCRLVAEICGFLRPAGLLELLSLWNDGESHEIRPGADTHLSEDLVQVILDRARADEQLCGDLRVRRTVRDEPRNARLLRCQQILRADLSPAHPLTGCDQFQ